MGAMKHALHLVEVKDNFEPNENEMQFLSFVQNKIEIALPSEVCYLNNVTSFLSQQAVRFGIIQIGDPGINIALDEAIANAIIHGNRRDTTKCVYITADYSTREARFTIRDEGRGFDPADVPDPRELKNRCNPSGRGILLMRHLMDEVIYNQKGNEVTLIRRPEIGEANIDK